MSAGWLPGHAPGGWRLGHAAQIPTHWLSAEGKAHREHREKLELVASFSFFGNVMSMASVQLAGAKRDALLLSFKDAKVGVGSGGRGGAVGAGAGRRGAAVGGPGSDLPPPAVGSGVRPGHPRSQDPVSALL